jgi:DNA-binding Lrp family transcriptional regulator
MLQVNRPARRRVSRRAGTALAYPLFRRANAMRAIFVMIKCEMGQAYRVAREMADGIPELSEMHSISGQYDLLGKFYLEAGRDIGLFVVETVQTVPGVKDTYTLQTFNAFSGRGG